MPKNLFKNLFKRKPQQDLSQILLRIEELEKRLTEAEKLLVIAKTYSAQLSATTEAGRRKKWLNSYPDQTEKPISGVRGV